MVVQIAAGVFFALLWLLVLGRILTSWVDPGGRSTLGHFLFTATEPLIAPVRRILPPTGMFDFSTFLVLVVLGLIWRALL
jgi:YggT family protein